MKILNTVLIAAVCCGLQSHGDASNQQAAKELARALVMGDDYVKAEAILKQYPELAKGFEYTNSAGYRVQINPLFWITDITLIPEERLNQTIGMAKLLLKLGADVNVIYHQQSIMHVFARNILKTEKQKNIAKELFDLLLTHGAEIDKNRNDTIGKTPLIVAVTGYDLDLDIIKMLVEDGQAKLDVKDNAGRTALQALQATYDVWLEKLQKDQNSTDLSAEDKEIFVKEDQDQVNTRKFAIGYLESRMKQAK